jgi:hypothetical protein
MRNDPRVTAANVSLRERAAALRRENAHLRQALDAAQESVRIWARIAVNQR